ncbi:MAG: hypothetical protein ACTHVK_10625, partial [Brachybacterium sp.]
MALPSLTSVSVSTLELVSVSTLVLVSASVLVSILYPGVCADGSTARLNILSLEHLLDIHQCGPR